MDNNFSNNTDDCTALSLLLERYARRIVGDQKAAEDIVLFLLRDQFKIGTVDDSKKVRLELKEELYLRCFRHKQLQIFDRPVIKRTLLKSDFRKNK